MHVALFAKPEARRNAMINGASNSSNEKHKRNDNTKKKSEKTGMTYDLFGIAPAAALLFGRIRSFARTE